MMISKRLDSKLSTRIGCLIAVEIVLIAGSFAYLALFENSNALIGNSINIAGKNRFLTATVLLESQYYLSDHTRKPNVEDSLKNLESNILLLRDGGRAADIEVGALPSKFIEDWQAVHENWIAFKIKTEQSISSDTPAGQIPTSPELKALGNSLIASSDSLVTKLGEYSKRISAELVILQVGLGILNIGVHFLMLYMIVRILKPIKLLTEATAAVREGNLNISLAQKGNDELQRLTESFNSMVQSLRQTSHILAVEKQRYQDLYDGAPDLYRMTDRKGIVLDCNDSYVRNLGYLDKNELIGKSIFETTADQSLDAMQEAFETWRRKGIIENKEIWLKRKDGSIFPTLISATAAAVYHGNREIVASNTCMIDVTKMYKAKRELEAANKQLADLNRMKTDFIRIASHELRTPIQPILGYSELAQRGAVSPKVALDVINQQARRLQHLANDILDITTIGGGDLGLEIVECSINEMIRKVMKQGEDTLGKDVKIELELNPEYDETMIFVDKQRMAQVISNIVNNSIKFTKKGFIRVSTRNVYDGRYIEICVTDTGSGIPQEILPSLFTIFAAKSVNEGADHGTGFGLFISKAIVKAHGGSIIGYNNPTGGASFRIRLPTGKDGLSIAEKTREGPLQLQFTP
jgi:PAS domain S-box-containing protein